MLATKAVPAIARSDHTIDQCGSRLDNAVTRRARKSNQLNIPYPKTWRPLRRKKCQVGKLTGSTPNRKCKRGYRNRLVLEADARFLDSIAMTPSHRRTNSQAIHTLRRDVDVRVAFKGVSRVRFGVSRLARGYSSA